jgi:hypothetical protein
MDTHSNRSEELNDLERRLSAWQPHSAGLDVDAMLFTAGRASMRPSPGRFVWPALAVLMTASSLVLGMWLADERHERLSLVSRLQEHPTAPAVNPSLLSAVNTIAEEPTLSDELPPNSYLASRRALEKGLDAWPIRAVVHAGPTNPSVANPTILRLGQRDALLEP